MEDMDEIVQEFLVESHENLDQLDRDLVALEQEPKSRDLLSSVFRTIHTIKGTSGFLAFNGLEAVTHVGENLLSRLRDGELTLTPERTSALLELVDAVRALLTEIERTGVEGAVEHGELVARLTRLADPAVEQASEPVAEPAVDLAPEPLTVETLQPATPEGVPAALLGQVLRERGSVTGDDVTLALVSQEVGDTRLIGEILVADGATNVREVADALEVQGQPRRSIADSTIRVDVELLDSLMNLVGELVLTRNQLVQRAAAREDTELLRTTHRLNLIAGELQEGVMKTRMQPIDNVWSKLPRVVRDLSVALGKTINVSMEGRDTELDKTILEAVKDPLTHLVRNSVDHGIETSHLRIAAGKPAEGTLTLRAYHEGGQVNIEIRDDGAGIDPDRLRAKAVSSGAMTREAADRLTDREAINLIFGAGFSTAEKVTNVSGRGVGMDVVKTNIEKIGGLIDVNSVVGRGTTFRIKIPLTLAIIPALIVTCDERRYAIPQVNLLELVRIERGSSAQQVEEIHGTPVYRLRGALLPLVHLREQFEHARSESDTTYIVVLQAGERQFGLVVDDIRDTEEIVVKPLGKQLRGISLFAGATIMGDGHVSLILDANALAQQAGMVSDSARSGANTANEAHASADRVSLLLVGLSDGRRVGLPLGEVDRLEEFACASLERVGANEVMQYRGRILPLVRLDGVYGAYGAPVQTESVQVVVCERGGALIGFIVHSILDIVDAELTVRSGIDTGGRLGSAVVSGHVTELVDVGHAIGSVDPAFIQSAAPVLVEV